MAEADPHRAKYEQWVRIYAPALYRYAYRLAGKRHIAEDLLQETFVEAWRSIERQTHAQGARGWLFQILRRRYSHFLRDTRSQRQTRSLDQRQDDHPPAALPLPLQRLADQDAMQAALALLNPSIRQTLLMVFVEGLTCRETAATLQIPIGTVLSRLDSARRSLRQALGEAAPSSPASKPKGARI
jgi:RNA polymerase sigma-70 factor (ECF subfamily)